MAGVGEGEMRVEFQEGEGVRTDGAEAPFSLSDPPGLWEYKSSGAILWLASDRERGETLSALGFVSEPSSGRSTRPPDSFQTFAAC